MGTWNANCKNYLYLLFFLSRQIWFATIFANGWIEMIRKAISLGHKPPCQNGIEKPRSCNLRGFLRIYLDTHIISLPIGIIAYAHEMSNMPENLLSLFFFICGSNIFY